MTSSGQNVVCRRRDLPLYLSARFLSELAALVLSVAASWTIYERSNSPLALGVAGLVEFVPMILLTLPAGELSDRLSPRLALLLGLSVQTLCAAGFFVLTFLPLPSLMAFYAILLLSGAGRAFTDPSGQALLPFLVPAERLPSAIAWGSSAWQLALIAGPPVGGAAYTAGASVAFAASIMGFVIAMLSIAKLGAGRSLPADTPTQRVRFARVIEGIRFVRANPILLGAISLDLFAVLFGGATALLPVYARDILHVGPMGLGLLRGAPAAGACIMALWQVRHPPARHAGLTLFAAIAVFGFATLIFALSTSFALSSTALFVAGASDMVSVNIRSCLVQMATPDTMRGRVSAINMMFIGASSELGAFESGVTAAWLGTVPAVFLGGLGTLLIALTWMFLFPSLREADRVSQSSELNL